MNGTARRFDWIVTGLAFALAAVVFRETRTSLVAQDAASGGPMRDAAFFPEVVAWAVLGLALVNVAQLVRARHAGPDASARPALPGSASSGETTPRTGLAIVCGGLFVLYLLALPTAGYYAATPVLMLALMRLLGVGWPAASLSALAFALGVAWVFEGLLDVVLPLGVAKFTLFG